MGKQTAKARDWLSVKQIADLLFLSRDNAMAMLKEGIIPAERHGSQWGARAADLEAWQTGQAPAVRRP